VKRDVGSLSVDENPFGQDRIVKQVGETFPGGRSFITYDSAETDMDNTQEYVVPAGHYFFMGDNRDNSLDSRVGQDAGGVGFVPAENLQGKAQIILLSWERAELFKPWTWVMNARPHRFFKLVK
jgi:signal peptidase I